MSQTKQCTLGPDDAARVFKGEAGAKFAEACAGGPAIGIEVCGGNAAQAARAAGTTLGDALLYISAESETGAADVEAFYGGKIDGADDTPVSHGLNSQLVRCDDGLVERAWHIGGLYSEAIEEVVLWLERAIEVAENAEHDGAEGVVAMLETILRRELSGWI